MTSKPRAAFAAHQRRAMRMADIRKVHVFDKRRFGDTLRLFKCKSWKADRAAMFFSNRKPISASPVSMPVTTRSEVHA
jgi:hypothetical protein